MRFDKEVWLAAFGGLCLGLLAAGIFCFPQYGWAQVFKVLPQINWEFKFWEAVTALGTLGAVGAALGIANRQAKVMRDEALSRAQLYAARISVRLLKLAQRINQAHQIYGFEDESVSRRENNVYDHGRLLELLKEETFVPDASELAALLPLPNQCAHRIAVAYDRFAELKRDALDPWKVDFFRRASDQSQLALLSKWFDELAEISSLLLVAGYQLREASLASASMPTFEELDEVPWF